MPRADRGLCPFDRGLVRDGFVAKRIDRWRFPWGYVDSGRPALVGNWLGTLTSGSGQRLGVLLDLQLAPLDRNEEEGTPIIRSPGASWLEGRVFVCSASGAVKHFNMWGKPDDSAASRFHLSLNPADSVPPDGLLYLRRGTSAITSTADADTKGDTPLTLRRGTEADFASLCSRLVKG